jgi:hypothetical protein
MVSVGECDGVRWADVVEGEDVLRFESYKAVSGPNSQYLSKQSKCQDHGCCVDILIFFEFRFSRNTYQYYMLPPSPSTHSTSSTPTTNIIEKRRPFKKAVRASYCT